MKRLGFLFTFVAVLSLLLTTGVSAQATTPNNAQGQGTTSTFTTQQGTTIGDLMDQANIDVGNLAVPSNENDIGLLQEFVNLNPNLQFPAGTQLNIPNANSNPNTFNNTVTLQSVLNQYNLNSNSDLRNFFSNNMNVPVVAGQTVQIPVTIGSNNNANNNNANNNNNNANNNNNNNNANNQKSLKASVYAGSVLNWAVYGSNGNLVGEVRGMIYDTSKAQIPYIVVLGDNVFSKHEVLIPWGAFSTSASAYGQAYFNNPTPYRRFDPTRDMQVVLPITEAQFQNAPEFDLSDFINNGLNTYTPGWDTGVVDYWNGFGLGTTFNSYNYNPSGVLVLESGIFDRIDYTVKNSAGNVLGHVDHLIVNPDGSVPYGLFQSDNLNLNLGSNYVALHMNALKWSPDQQAFILNVPEGTLSNAPIFNLNNQPNLANPNWEQGWNNFWNPYIGTGNLPVTGNNNVSRKNLLGDEIFYGNNNTRLGNVQDVIMNGNNSVGYLVVYDSQTDQFHPIPWNMFNYNSNDNTLNYSGTINQFHNAPGYNNISDIHNNQSGWNNSIDSYWNGL